MMGDAKIFASAWSEFFSSFNTELNNHQIAESLIVKGGD